LVSDAPVGPLLRKPGPGAGAPGAPAIFPRNEATTAPPDRLAFCSARQVALEGRILEGVSQVERSVAEEVVELDDEERAWLEERLREYRDLLVYLHDH
jgi:hypothetical protein